MIILFFIFWVILVFNDSLPSNSVYAYYKNSDGKLFFVVIGILVVDAFLAAALTFAIGACIWLTSWPLNGWV